MIIRLLKQNKEKGYVAFFITILILSIMIGIAFSIIILTLNAEKISSNIIKSSRAYYAAEAGIEDSLLRVFSGLPYSPSNTFSVGKATVTTLIDKLRTSLIIQSIGDFDNRIRNLEIEAKITSTEANFYYGVQVGDGGLTMAGNSKVFGNIYSNGSVLGADNTEIYGDLYVAGNTGTIDNMNIIKVGTDDGNAHAHTIFNSNIENGAYYQSISGTSAATYFPGSPDPEPEEMPLTDEQINSWKDVAAEGGTISGYSLGGNQKDSLGPIKVAGDFTMNSNSMLTQTGTIWVTGDIIISSNAVVQLDSGYGLNSGVIIANGKILLESNVVICGSEGYNKSKNCHESLGSFLMFVSTNSSLNPSSPAIESTSNSQSAILYANQGIIKLDSNAALKEVTGYALYLESNATVTYESGLANVNFTSGPGGGWEIISWKEIE